MSPSDKLTEEVATFEMLDKKCQEHRAFFLDKKYENLKKTLGAGLVGHPMAPIPYERGCERALHYGLQRVKSDRPLSASTIRIFKMNERIKDVVADNLIEAGFQLQRHDVNGNKYGFAVAPDPETGLPRFNQFSDGVIVGGPARVGSEKDGADLRYPMLWVCKPMDDKKLSRFISEGLERSHPQYYGEVQVTMNFMNLYVNPALVTAISRDTGDMRVEYIRFRQKHAQAALDRAARVIEARGPLMLERAADKYEDLPCRNCEYASTCQQDEANRSAGPNPTTEAPAWLTGENNG